GNPKGVMIEHYSVINRLNWMQKKYPIGTEDVILQKTPFTFDVSVWELFWWAFRGARVCFLKPGGEKDPEAIAEAIENNKVTTMHFVPSMLNAFMEYMEEHGGIDRLSSLKKVFASGEALSAQQVKRFNRLFYKSNGTELYNLYGPTEATVDVSYFDCSTGDEPEVIPIGKPIDNINLYILDKNNRLQPIGVAGELHIAGDGLARGYLGRPELTEEKFVPNHFVPGTRMYKTGDLARWLPDGNIEYLGRIDQQVKIRGFRIELGEIESKLTEYPAVKEAVVIDRDNAAGDRYLSAYYVSDEVISAQSIRTHLLKVLPDYMLPSFIVRIDEIPLTANGKIDKKKLFSHETDLNQEIEYVAPRNSYEHEIASIWSEVLGHERVGINDNFFSLGGDSIKAIRVANYVSKVLNTDIQIADLYQYSTIRELYENITQRPDTVSNEEKVNAAQEIEALKNNIFADNDQFSRLPSDYEDFYPMTDIEYGMIYHSLRNKEEAVYHEQFVYKISIPFFNYGIFKKAVTLMVEKHPSLRSTYNLGDFDVPLHIILKSVRLDIEEIDIRNMSEQERLYYIQQYLENDRRRPFNTMEAPVWRIRAFKSGEDIIYICCIFHHVIMDGWSNASFITELVQIYFNLLERNYVPDKLKNDYKEAVLNQYAFKKKENIIEYWKKELHDYKRLALPKIQNKKGIGKTEIKSVFQKLEPETIERLKLTANQNKVGLKAVYLAAYIFTMNMISFENDMTLGVVEHIRPACEDGEKILGCFLNTVPIRVLLDDAMTGSGLIKLVGRKLTELKKYAQLSLLEITKAVGEDSQSGNPIFDTIFNYVDFHVYSNVNDKLDIRSTASAISYERTNTYLDFSVSNTPGFSGIKATYQENTFTEEDIRIIIEYFNRALNLFISDPDMRIDKDCLLHNNTREKILHTFNNTQAQYPKDKTIHRMFEEQAERTPQAVAGVFEGNEITYRELNEKSNAVAAELRRKGMKLGSIAGIMVERSLEMIVGIMGILKAGGAYMPISPEYPEARIKYMLEDSKACVLVTQEDLDGKFAFDVETINLNNKELYKGDCSNPVNTSGPTDLAYVIYTSGSTGNPKGVMIEHYSVINRLNWMQKKYPIGTEDVILQKTPFTFDVSVWELFWWAFRGARVCFLKPGGEKDPEVIVEAIENNKVTTMHFVPSMLSAFMEYMEEHGGIDRLSSLKKVFASGEALSVQQVKRFNRLFYKSNGTELYNLYGPTEATVDVSYFDCSAGDEPEVIPIGKPIDNINLYILDKNNRL
ncbi:MAG TPA: amino acid adenylation domain-containing protein, partial [Clostridia bacterium]|nr:amino acid adenylation domain-containing protein [Clostridia bacterium]